MTKIQLQLTVVCANEDVAQAVKANHWPSLDAIAEMTGVLEVSSTWKAESGPPTLEEIAAQAEALRRQP